MDGGTQVNRITGGSMNWYKQMKLAQIMKVSSVTFFVSDSHKISQPKGLLDLCHDFTNFVYNRAKINNEGFLPTMDDVSPDTSSSDFDGYTGTINFYSRPREYQDKTYENSPESVAEAVKLWTKDKEQEGYIFENNGKIETSRMFGYPVQRISVMNNPSSEYTQIPEVNMANDNARAMLTLIGIGSDGIAGEQGEIDAQELLRRINEVSREQIDGATTPSGYISNETQLDDPEHPRESWQGEIETYDSPPEEEGVKMFTGGRDANYIDNRLQGLYNLADFAVSNGFKEIAWA